MPRPFNTYVCTYCNCNATKLSWSTRVIGRSYVLTKGRVYRIRTFLLHALIVRCDAACICLLVSRLVQWHKYFILHTGGGVAVHAKGPNQTNWTERECVCRYILSELESLSRRSSGSFEFGIYRHADLPEALNIHILLLSVSVVGMESGTHKAMHCRLRT